MYLACEHCGLRLADVEPRHLLYFTDRMNLCDECYMEVRDAG